MFTLTQIQHITAFYFNERGSTGIAEMKDKVEVQPPANEVRALLERDNLVSSISGQLKGKFDSLALPFDLKGFEEKLSKSISEILLSDKIPFIAKRKFIDDVKMKVDKYFSTITVDDLQNLRNIRKRNSLGVSEIEFKGKTEKEIQMLHLNMILASNLETYIGGSVTGLREAFLAESTKMNGGEYSKKGLDEYSKMIAEIDIRYGLSMSNIAKDSKERASKAGIDFMNAGLFLDMRLALIRELADKDPEFAKKQASLIATLNTNPTFQIQYHPSMTVKLNEKIYPLRDIVNDYAKVNGTWHQKEHEIRDARATALADNLLSKTKKALGTEQLRSEFDKISEGDMENIIKNSSLADIMIMITQVAQIVPALGDILGGVMDTSDAINGMNAKGEKFTGLERLGSGVLGGLGILIVGGLINRIRKGPKYAKILELLTKYLPANIEKFQKMGGELTKDMKEKILKFTRDIGATTLGQRMQETFENKLATGFTEQQKQNRRVEKTSGISLSSEKVQIKSEAEIALRKAGLIGPEEHITDAQVDLIFAGHKSGKPKGQQDFGSIRDKARASEGLPKEWKRILMREGIMGESNDLKSTIETFKEKRSLFEEDSSRLFSDTYEKGLYDSLGRNYPDLPQEIRKHFDELLIKYFISNFSSPKFISEYPDIPKYQVNLAKTAAAQGRFRISRKLEGMDYVFGIDVYTPDGKIITYGPQYKGSIFVFNGGNNHLSDTGGVSTELKQGNLHKKSIQEAGANSNFSVVNRSYSEFDIENLSSIEKQLAHYTDTFLASLSGNQKSEAYRQKAKCLLFRLQASHGNETLDVNAGIYTYGNRPLNLSYLAINMEWGDIMDRMTDIQAAQDIFKKLLRDGYVVPNGSKSIEDELKQATRWLEDLRKIEQERNRFESYKVFLDRYSGSPRDFFTSASTKSYFDYFVQNWDSLPNSMRTKIQNLLHNYFKTQFPEGVNITKVTKPNVYELLVDRELQDIRHPILRVDFSNGQLAYVYNSGSR